MNTITKEQLFHEYLVNQKSLVKIGKELNISHKFLSKLGKKWNLPIRSMLLNIKNKKYGLLTVLEYYGLSEDKRTMWVCLCDCGCLVLKASKRLVDKKATHCGCLIIKKQENLKWKHFKDITGTCWAKYVNGAKKRNLEFSITKEYVYKIYLEQDKKCKFTKIPIKFSGDVKCTASIDRIDSKKGYIEGNIQIVHKHINIMKQAFKDGYFKNMCRLIAENNIYEQREKEIFDAHLQWEYSGGFAVYQKIVKQQDKIRKSGELMTKEQLKERIQAFLSFGEILAKATKNPQDDQLVKFLQTILASDVAFDVLYFVYTKLFNKETMKFDNLKSFLSVNSD